MMVNPLFFEPAQCVNHKTLFSDAHWHLHSKMWYKSGINNTWR